MIPKKFSSILANYYKIQANYTKYEMVSKTLHKGLPDEREAVKAMTAFNPGLMTWDDHRRKIAELECRSRQFMAEAAMNCRFWEFPQ